MVPGGLLGGSHEQDIRDIALNYHTECDLAPIGKDTTHLGSRMSIIQAGSIFFSCSLSSMTSEQCMQETKKAK